MATAVTRDFTRTNPTATPLGTIQRNFAVSVFKVVLSNANDAVALNAGTAQQFIEEIGTTGMMIQVKSDGTEVFIVGERHALDIDSLAIRLGRQLDSTPGSRTSSGVYTCGGGGTVTVTEPTDLEGM
jgi:hypothetical protein